MRFREDKCPVLPQLEAVLWWLFLGPSGQPGMGQPCVLAAGTASGRNTAFRLREGIIPHFSALDTASNFGHSSARREWQPGVNSAEERHFMVREQETTGLNWHEVCPWRQLGSGREYPEMLCRLHPCRCWRPNWIKPWTTWSVFSEVTQLWAGDWTEVLIWFFPASLILQVYSMIQEQFLITCLCKLCCKIKLVFSNATGTIPCNTPYCVDFWRECGEGYS